MPEQIILIAFVIAVIFSAVHITAPKLYGFSERYKEAVISFSGGIAVAYIFFDLVPGAEKGDPKFFVAGALIYAAVLLLLI